jgi:gamma-butyrobetaine dioxygenase
MPDIRIAAGAPAALLMLRDAQGERPLPALWLRARSPDPLERDEVTGQRLTNPHQLPDDLRLTDARSEGGRLRLSFSDGHSSLFDPQELIDGAILDEGCPAARAWRADLSPLPIHQWPELDRDDKLFAATRDLIEYGFVLIHATPTDPKAILDIARRFGTPVPGLQLLHCLQNETSGGLSTLVDSLAVAEQLQREDPEGFALLSRIPVRFEYRDAGTQLVAVKPMIELDGMGQMIGVHYSPRLDDIPLMPDADTRRYHRARKRFGQLFEDPQYELRFRLDPGQLMMFDNNRVLHGRTSFDPSEGHRQLQGCYIDRDGPRSLYRVLKRRLATH